MRKSVTVPRKRPKEFNPPPVSDQLSFTADRMMEKLKLLITKQIEMRDSVPPDVIRSRCQGAMIIVASVIDDDQITRSLFRECERFFLKETNRSILKWTPRQTDATPVFADIKAFHADF